MTPVTLAAILLERRSYYKKFGQTLSQKILDAHEENPKQPYKEKTMDTANNYLGLKTAALLKKKNKLNKREILQSFQKNLKEANLIILNPGAKKASSKSVVKKIWDQLHKKQRKNLKNQKADQ